jgi:hypothetical protein
MIRASAEARTITGADASPASAASCSTATPAPVSAAWNASANR